MIKQAIISSLTTLVLLTAQASEGKKTTFTKDSKKRPPTTQCKPGDKAKINCMEPLIPASPYELYCLLFTDKTDCRKPSDKRRIDEESEL